MEYGVSPNDPVPVRTQRWLFLVGQAEPWLNPGEQGQGTRFYKQGVIAKRSSGDKYNNPPHWNIQPQHGPGVITLGGSLEKTAFCGGIAHVAIWNRLLASEEIAQIFAAGTAELLGGVSKRG